MAEQPMLKFVSVDRDMPTKRDAGLRTEVRENSIEADHVVHLSLTEGLDHNWPFGTSVLEAIFKVFKQKELLEDAIIIYRVQRAPERLSLIHISEPTRPY